MIGQTHAHVPIKKWQGWICSVCFKTLRAILEGESCAEIVFDRVEQWTAWQTPRTDEVGKS